MTKVSVIIPFYNRIEWLIVSVNSVIDQTYTDFELILVDDGSTDPLPKGYITSDRRLRYIRQENLGPAAARNRGIDASTGEYIAFLDSDDVFLSSKLEKQVLLMEANPDIVLSHTSYIQMDNHGETIGITQSGTFSGRVYPNIIQFCPIATPTVMIRRNAIVQGLCFNEKYRIGEDILFWIHLTQINPIILGIPEPLTRVRIHGRNAALDHQAQIEFQLIIIKTVLNKGHQIPYIKHRVILSSIYLNIAYQYYQIGNNLKYIQYLLFAITIWPINQRYFSSIWKRLKKTNSDH